VCVLTYLVPTELGSNVTRIRFAALPCALLVVALRRWRPLSASILVVGLALSWNVEPFVRQALTVGNSADSNSSYWQPAIRFLRAHAGRSYRVEAVDTATHSPALYLASAEIPLARGWFRQDDFPLNALLYAKRLSPRSYLTWLHELGVEYVVLSAAPPDYSSRAEAVLLRSGKSGLARVFADGHLTIYRTPQPQGIIAGPPDGRVLALTGDRVILSVEHPGSYRVGVRYSPYWHTSAGCIEESADGMMRLRIVQRGRLVLSFDITGGNLLRALTDSRGTCPRAQRR
jgi:hypothetical protein